MLRVEVINAAGTRVPVSVVRTIARRAQKDFAFPPRTDMTCTFVTDAAMRDVNRRTRRVGRATDVLAFPLHAPKAWRRARRDADGRLRLGDVVIAVPTARRQARTRGVPLAREVGALFAHGLLHCLGYDHATARAAAAMSRATARLWRA